MYTSNEMNFMVLMMMMIMIMYVIVIQMFSQKYTVHINMTQSLPFRIFRRRQ